MDFTAFQERLAALVHTARIDMIIPTCEELFWAARARPTLGARVEVFTPDLETLRTLHHKGMFARLAAGYGLRAPRTVTLTDEDQLRALHADPSQLVFKPAHSRFGTRVLVGPRPEDLRAVRPTAASPWVAQDLVMGQEWSAYAVARAGRLAAHAMYAPRFRYGGVAVQYEAAEQPSVQAWVTDFVERSGLTGQVAFDFIVDDHGDAWALECNPRLTGGIHLFYGQPGVARAFVGKPPEAPLRPAARSGRMLGAAMLLGGHLATRAGRCAFARSTDILLDRRDPLPGVAQPLLLAALAARSLRTRGGLRAVSTHDIEWNGES